jgi:Ca2+/Na+ antiporter
MSEADADISVNEQDEKKHPPLPPRSEIKRFGLFLMIIVSGMIITHFFFTLMVSRSDSQLHATVLQAIDAGYLPIPNELTLPSLTQWGTAFKGAFFFTLTVGIALPLLVYLAAFAWEIGYRRSRKFLIVLSGFVIFILFMLNRHGFNPMVTFWFLITYFALFKLSSHVIGKSRPALSRKRLLTHIFVLVVLAVMFKVLPPPMDFFLTVRDHYLFSNTIGNKVTDFYYRYSPYPTETVKPLIKKQLKLCRIDGETDTGTYGKIERTLISFNALPVSDPGAGSIRIVVDEKDLIFFVQERKVIRTSIDNFIENPKVVFNRISFRSDRNDITRRLLAVSLFLGLPLFLYIVLFSILHISFRLFHLRESGFYLSATACLVLALIMIVSIRLNATETLSPSMIKEKLESPSSDERTVALKNIVRQGLDPEEYLPMGYSTPPTYVPERIWWVISLSNSENPDSIQRLLLLLDDPNLLVSCKAYAALGRKGYRPAISTILEKIGSSQYWYVQGYAYQSLRSLGWKQNASD